MLRRAAGTLNPRPPHGYLFFNKRARETGASRAGAAVAAAAGFFALPDIHEPLHHKTHGKGHNDAHNDGIHATPPF